MKKVRICILSTAHVHTPTYVQCLKRNPNAEIVGFFDDEAERGEAFARKYEIPFWTDAEELLRRNLDVAIVCSENRKHAKWVTLAAEAGVDVLCEKPLGSDDTDMQSMIAFCRAKGVRLMTAMCNRYIHSFQEAARAVKAGRIGKLVAVFASNKGTMPGGWFVNEELSGGGCVIDHTVHVADLMNCMLGALPEEVFAQAGNRLFEMDVEDCAVVTLRYPGNVLVTLDASWSRTRHFPYGRDLTLRFVGTEGSVCVDYFAEHNCLYAQGERIYNYYGEDKDQMMMDELVECYLTGSNYPITGEDGRRCALVAEAAYQSLREGIPVRLGERDAEGEKGQ